MPLYSENKGSKILDQTTTFPLHTNLAFYYVIVLFSNKVFFNITPLIKQPKQAKSSPIKGVQE